MKCLNQCAVIVGSVVNIGMKIVKIVIWEGLGAGRRTTDGGMADDGRRTGGHHLGSGVFFFFWNHGILHHQKRGKDCLLQQFSFFAFN
jgi:hypothetical protein